MIYELKVKKEKDSQTINYTDAIPLSIKKYVVRAYFLTSQVLLNPCNARKAHGEQSDTHRN